MICYHNVICCYNIMWYVVNVMIFYVLICFHVVWYCYDMLWLVICCDIVWYVVKCSDMLWCIVTCNIFWHVIINYIVTLHVTYCDKLMFFLFIFAQSATFYDTAFPPLSSMISIPLIERYPFSILWPRKRAQEIVICTLMLFWNPHS